MTSICLLLRPDDAATAYTGFGGDELSTTRHCASRSVRLRVIVKFHRLSMGEYHLRKASLRIRNASGIQYGLT